MNRVTIRELIIKYLNEQDDYSLSYKKLEECFPNVGANFDVCISRMEPFEVSIGKDSPFIVILNPQYRKRRK